MHQAPRWLSGTISQDVTDAVICCHGFENRISLLPHKSCRLAPRDPKSIRRLCEKPKYHVLLIEFILALCLFLLFFNTLPGIGVHWPLPTFLSTILLLKRLGKGWEGKGGGGGKETPNLDDSFNYCDVNTNEKWQEWWFTLQNRLVNSKRLKTKIKHSDTWYLKPANNNSSSIYMTGNKEWAELS